MGQSLETRADPHANAEPDPNTGSKPHGNARCDAIADTIIRIRRDRKAFCVLGAHKKGHPVQHRNSGEDKPATSPEPVFQHRTLYNIVNQGNSPRPKSQEDHQPPFLKRPTLCDFT